MTEKQSKKTLKFEKLEPANVRQHRIIKKILKNETESKKWQQILTFLKLKQVIFFLKNSHKLFKLLLLSKHVQCPHQSVMWALLIPVNNDDTNHISTETSCQLINQSTNRK